MVPCPLRVPTCPYPSPTLFIALIRYRLQPAYKQPTATYSHLRFDSNNSNNQFIKKPNTNTMTKVREMTASSWCEINIAPLD